MAAESCKMSVGGRGMIGIITQAGESAQYVPTARTAYFVYSLNIDSVISRCLFASRLNFFNICDLSGANTSKSSGESFP